MTSLMSYLPAFLTGTKSGSQYHSFVQLSTAGFWRCSERFVGALLRAASSLPQHLDSCKVNEK